MSRSFLRGLALLLMTLSIVGLTGEPSSQIPIWQIVIWDLGCLAGLGLGYALYQSMQINEIESLIDRDPTRREVSFQSKTIDWDETLMS